MKTSKQSRQIARQIVRLSMKDGVLDDSKVRQAMDLIVERKPRGYIGTLEALSKFVRLELERRHAVIESAIELDAASIDRIKKELYLRHGNDLTIETRTNPELIAGLRIQIGSDVWDGSVRSRLDQLAESFA